MQKPVRIVIGGEGGQGVQTIAKILARAFYHSGRKITYLPNYGVEQRGGVSIAFVQVCKCREESRSCSCDIGFPKFEKADILINLCERAIERTKRYVKKEALYIYDNSLIDKESLNGISCPKIAVPAAKLSKKISTKVFNVIILGAVISYTEIVSKQFVIKAIDEEFSKKFKEHPELRHLNRRAFEVGWEMMKQIETRGKILSTKS